MSSTRSWPSVGVNSAITLFGHPGVAPSSASLVRPLANSGWRPETLPGRAAAVIPAVALRKELDVVGPCGRGQLAGKKLLHRHGTLCAWAWPAPVVARARVSATGRLRDGHGWTNMQPGGCV